MQGGKGGLQVKSLLLWGMSGKQSWDTTRCEDLIISNHSPGVEHRHLFFTEAEGKYLLTSDSIMLFRCTL
jgi:hypothetical protein